MKKLFYLSVLIICLTGCKNNDFYINTIIERKNNCFVTINYPVTNRKKVDKKIEEYINDKYDYITNTTNELNIDYTFNIVANRYINISLETYINNGNNNYDIISFIFDIKKEKFLTLNDLVSSNSLSTIHQILNENLNEQANINYNNLTFDENNLYFYLRADDGIKKIIVPIYDTEFLINIDVTNKKLKENSKIINNKIIDPNKPVVAITFDDGPSKYTNEILDILNNNNANATFFVLGNKVKNYSSTLNKMIMSGNEIGNHSYNHKNLNRLNNDELLFQINSTQDIIYEITGYTPIYIRPTYGNISENLKKNTTLEIILWTVDPEDWKYKNSKTIANKVLNKTQDGSIILLHDTKKRTVDALKIIIEELKKREFQFVTISELKLINKIRYNLGINDE